MNRTDFFAEIWNQYIQVTPQAKRIQVLFHARGEHVVNDHVAFRTFDIEGFDLDRATELLAAIGYESFDHYTFPDKHLRAGQHAPPSAKSLASHVSEPQPVTAESPKSM